MYYYLYKITNLLNKKCYIGIHATEDLNDGYFGSGKLLKQAISKHGRENFKKEILEFFNSYDELAQKEKQIVNKNFIESSNTYNLREGGYGSFSYINSLPNQGHKPGQHKEAALASSYKLKNDKEHRIKRVEKLTKNAHKMIKEGKMYWQKTEYINPALLKKWISHDEEKISKYVDSYKLENYLKSGWYLGRKYNPYNLNRSSYKKRI